MKTLSGKNALFGALALAATLATPLAFAQSADPTSPQATPPAAAIQDSTTTSQSDAAAPTSDSSVQADTGNQDATAAASVGPSSAPVKKSWSDVDLDKDGNLSKTEAGTVPALGQVFDKADGNADGSLTADEYKNYVAKAQGGASAGDDRK